MIMKGLARLLAFIALAILVSCSVPRKTGSKGPSGNPVSKNKINSNMSDSFLWQIFKDDPEVSSAVLADSKELNVQVIFSQVNRDRQNKPSLTTYTYHLNDRYFYPASTIKLPLALLALEKVRSIDSAIDPNTAMITEAGTGRQTAVYNDPNSREGKPTVAGYVKKIFLVSDNDAANRLYEFLGQEYINSRLQEKGYTDAEVRHRLSISLSDSENKQTNAIRFYGEAGNLLYTQPTQVNTQAYTPRHNLLGEAYYANGRLINEPMDFSNKNKISLASLHDMMTDLVFPGIGGRQKFNLHPADRELVLQYMSEYPAESKAPYYDSITYYDTYQKFILWGSVNETPPGHIRIFNKSGIAYGQLTDVAYIVDFENKIEFFVSATISCNSDKVLNDDRYDYTTIGQPFLKALGQQLYNYELKRKKKFVPDLSSFRFNYDK